MEYTTLGETGVTVSRLCLGCMTFGDRRYRDWFLEEDEARPIIERAVELGINFFDTANIYSVGESERILGRALEDVREEMVIATKVHFPMDADDPNSGGLSQRTIDQQLDASLERLGIDTVDLYQIHRWDEKTSIEVTLRALDDAVSSGRVRYLGASSMWAYQLATALYTADRLGTARFATMQNFYNVAYREEEREMLPLCEREGLGVIPWSPLARGYLARPHENFEATTRGSTDDYTRGMEEAFGDAARTINERVEELADRKGASMAQVALAWVLHQEPVDAPIVGVSSVEQLEDAVGALEITLTEEEQDYLEAPYEPLEVMGHE